MQNYQTNCFQQKRLAQIKKHEIIERINIKKIESEIIDETKALEEIKTKLQN